MSNLHQNFKDNKNNDSDSEQNQGENDPFKQVLNAIDQLDNSFNELNNGNNQENEDAYLNENEGNLNGPSEVTQEECGKIEVESHQNKEDKSLKYRSRSIIHHYEFDEDLRLEINSFINENQSKNFDFDISKEKVDDFYINGSLINDLSFIDIFPKEIIKKKIIVCIKKIKAYIYLIKVQ